MIFEVFSVHDTKTGVYAPPFFERSRGAAIRGFTEVANGKDTSIGKFPGDFALFYLGQFDDETGQMMPVPAPQSLGLAQDFLNR